MNEVLAFRLYRDAGVPAPRTAYAQVYVSIPSGDRRGISASTASSRTWTRTSWNRASRWPADHLKPATTIPFRFVTRNWADYNQMYDPKTTPPTPTRSA